jgi:endoglucanase
MTIIAAPKIAGLLSAGPGVLAVVLESVAKERPADGTSATPDPLDLTPEKWQVNGAQPSKVHRYSLPWYETPALADGTVEITTRHQVYLTLPRPFVEGESYAVVTPYGTAAMTFGARETLAPCIKVNQASYARASTARWALLGVWRGDGGTMPILPMPTYEVVRESDGAVIHQGTAMDMGDDVGLTGPKSGEHPYKLDLSAVEEGGPYFVSVPGVGRSHDFYVGGLAERNTAEIALRAMTIARCGQELKAPWSPWNRAACHLQVADTRAPWPGNGWIQVPAGTRTFPIRGGYHDAGDYDRRPHHIIVPILLLTYHEAWPEHSDNAMGIPESGNGIPDLLNEALWGVLGLEHLQITDTNDPLVGGVRVGTEQRAHPGYGTDRADTDKGVYGTWGVDGVREAEGFTAFAAGVFAQASRLVRPYNATRADDLLNRAKLAWGYHWSHSNTDDPRAYNLYASLQLYLATGEPSFHNLFKSQASAILVRGGTWPVQYRPGNLSAQVQTVHFASYALPTSRIVEATLVDAIKDLVIREAKQGGYHGVRPLTDAYPVGATKFIGWGALTAPGRFDAPAFASRFTTDETERQQFINTMSALADGILGLNAMGMSYVVGLGVEQPNNPGHLDSYACHKETGKHLPGVTVYGPTDGRSGYNYQRAVTNKLYPDWNNAPIARRYVHPWGAINCSEKTVWEVDAWLATLWHFLHDASQDPPPTIPPPPSDPAPEDGVMLTAEQRERLKRIVADLNDLLGEMIS